MRFIETSIEGAWILEPAPRADERGFFARVWCESTLAEHGLNGRFVQCNNAFSRHRGTLRGLHGQAAPHGEAKLVRCIRGAIYDAVVDLRPPSPTYLQWFGTALTADDRRMVYVPPGCAHGYLSLSDDAEVMYPVTEVYTPSAEFGLRWNDPSFPIAWPEAVRHISDKDAHWPDFDPTMRLV